jgi:hypothetical protein
MRDEEERNVAGSLSHNLHLQSDVVHTSFKARAYL